MNKTNNIPNRNNDIENCLISKNPKDKLIENCTKEFGITKDPCEGGFLLENGEFLDFSEKKKGGSPGIRSYDHRDIGKCINSESCKNVQSFHKLRLVGIHGNTVRFHGSGCRSDYPMINIMLYQEQNPTGKQWEIIRNSVREKGRVIYDILDKEGYRIHSGTVSANKIGRLRMLFDTLKQ